MIPEARYCVDCKHYRYVEKEDGVELAHKNRCNKFKDDKGKGYSIAVARGREDRCGERGKAHEK